MDNSYWKGKWIFYIILFFDEYFFFDKCINELWKWCEILFKYIINCKKWLIMWVKGILIFVIKFIKVIFFYVKYY